MTTTANSLGSAIVRSSDGTPIGYESLGSGAGVIVVGGAFRSARDYVAFARVLAVSLRVHIIDRRGRGRSGPQGADYCIERELEDVFAVREQTGATMVFGHSYGGLIALEAARRWPPISKVALYEPAVCVDGSIPLGWLPRYSELLDAGDRRGAFAAMVQQLAPAPLARIPLWYVRLMLRLFIKQPQWRRVEPLLEAALAEHEQVARLGELSVSRYGDIQASVLLLGGSKSPSFSTAQLFDQLQPTIPNVAAELIDGLDHTAPDEKAPHVVATRVGDHFRGQTT